MSDIEIGSVWVSKKNKTAVLKVSAVEESNVTTHWLPTPNHPFEWRKYDFLSKYEPQIDMVNEPPHYKDASGIECIEVTKHMQFCGGNCFKYLYRAGKKGSTIEDLKKAAWYAERAWIMNEIVSHEVLEDIWAISAHRSGNVSLAMDFIAEDMWADAERFIKKEIARLESE